MICPDGCGLERPDISGFDLADGEGDAFVFSDSRGETEVVHAPSESEAWTILATRYAYETVAQVRYGLGILLKEVRHER